MCKQQSIISYMICEIFSARTHKSCLMMLIGFACLCLQRPQEEAQALGEASFSEMQTFQAPAPQAPRCEGTLLGSRWAMARFSTVLPVHFRSPLLLGSSVQHHFRDSDLLCFPLPTCVCRGLIERRRSPTCIWVSILKMLADMQL